MEHGRLVRVTTQAQRGGDAHVVYVVAEPDRTKAESIIRTKAARIEDNVEAIGRASQQLLKTLNLALGEFVRAEI
jgi:hypothetical protein